MSCMPGRAGPAAGLLTSSPSYIPLVRDKSHAAVATCFQVPAHVLASLLPALQPFAESSSPRPAMLK